MRTLDDGNTDGGKAAQSPVIFRGEGEVIQPGSRLSGGEAQAYRSHGSRDGNLGILSEVAALPRRGYTP